ncbi:MAG: hypothetical protein H6679_04245 [Epsilonproteobacteria bacterium]|nr:hypothetical protein [Campylobacterota bacterium]
MQNDVIVSSALFDSIIEQLLTLLASLTEQEDTHASLLQAQSLPTLSYSAGFDDEDDEDDDWDEDEDDEWDEDEDDDEWDDDEDDD